MTGAYLHPRIPALGPSLGTQRCASINCYFRHCNPMLMLMVLANRGFVVLAGYFVPSIYGIDL